VKQIVSKEPNTRAGREAGRNVWLAALLLILATVVAYSNSFNGPFVFDDLGTIQNNPTLLKCWPPWEVLVGPPGGTTASGRPLVNLSLALNHIVGGFNVRGYHVFNLAIHLAAGLVLFGIIRRTFLRTPLQGRFGSVALPIAFTCTALWLLHPLQTAAVTYTVQRAEALAGLFYLLTLYGFVRATDSPSPTRWQFISVASCLLGIASKEVVVSAPLFVFLYDRTIVSGSFSEAWKQRRSYYGALASTWLLLALLIISTQGRGGSVSVTESISPWTYALTQCRAIVHYLRLVVWPSPLIFDYGTATASSFIEVLPQFFFLTLLACGCVYAIWRRSLVGVAGAWFFMILAPSSSVVPIVTQTMAEHRMYLPLGAVLVLVLSAAVKAVGPRSLWVFLGAAALFGGQTFHRNNEYREAVTLWRDTVAKLPDSKRAHNNLGSSLFLSGDAIGACAEFQNALALDPRYVNALVNLGRVQVQIGAFADASTHFTSALAMEPTNAEAHFGLGFALASTGHLAEGIAHYREAIRLEPSTTDYRLKLAQALFRAHDATAAIEQFQELVHLAPTLVEAHTGLGTALASQGNFSEAERELTAALRLNPYDFDAHYNLGNAFAQQDRVAEAIPHYEAALRLRPDHVGAREILEQARAYLKSSK